ncbi:L-alanine exporter AlaE [Candidatus Woesearchaeota archaeon]|nr:L-alanine exporter AlaE [Candidatus Woesearchaeota archaeon]
MASLDDIVSYGLYGVKRALFMTPMMYLTEIISGLHSSQSGKSRLIALGVNFAVAMPYQEWFKPKIYKMMNVTDESLDYKKNIANKVAFAAHQIPIYTGILLVAGASAEQIAIALPTGVAVGVATAGKFQKFMDKASEFIKNKLYQTKDSFKYINDLGKTYAKNLLYASLIAATVKVGAVNAIKYVYENNLITNNNFVLACDIAQPEPIFYWTKK